MFQKPSAQLINLTQFALETIFYTTLMDSILEKPVPNDNLTGLAFSLMINLTFFFLVGKEETKCMDWLLLNLSTKLQCMGLGSMDKLMATML